MWKDRNDVVFSNQGASPQKVCNLVWSNLINYGRAAWSNTMKKREAAKGIKKKKLTDGFRSVWCRNDILAEWRNDRPIWHTSNPFE